MSEVIPKEASWQEVYTPHSDAIINFAQENGLQVLEVSDDGKQELLEKNILTAQDFFFVLQHIPKRHWGDHEIENILEFIHNYQKSDIEVRGFIGPEGQQMLVVIKPKIN